MLSYRARSRQEIGSDLRRKGFAVDTVDAVVRELEEKGLICDTILARDIVSAGQGAGKSRSKIYADLRRRGIARETVEDSLEEYFDVDEECEAALREMRKLLRVASGQSRDEEIERAARRLSGRGFCTAAVARAMKESVGGAHTPDEGSIS